MPVYSPASPQPGCYKANIWTGNFPMMLKSILRRSRNEPHVIVCSLCMSMRGMRGRGWRTSSSTSILTSLWVCATCVPYTMYVYISTPHVPVTYIPTSTSLSTHTYLFTLTSIHIKQYITSIHIHIHTYPYLHTHSPNSYHTHTYPCRIFPRLYSSIHPVDWQPDFAWAALQLHLLGAGRAAQTQRTLPRHLTGRCGTRYVVMCMCMVYMFSVSTILLWCIHTPYQRMYVVCHTILCHTPHHTILHYCVQARSARNTRISLHCLRGALDMSYYPWLRDTYPPYPLPSIFLIPLVSCHSMMSVTDISII